MYIDTSYKPGKKDVISIIKISPKTEETLNGVAAESSIGTWTDVKTMLPEIYERLRPKIYEIGEYVKIAYPMEALDCPNMPVFLASVCGNIFGMKMLESLRVEDIIFPIEMQKYYKGPKYGIEGVRNILKIYDRPLCGTIIKPKVGLPTELHAKVAYEAWRGGIDIVKDDENLGSQSFNKFEIDYIKPLNIKIKRKRRLERKKFI
jgi:ribulose-bisphosphate carboxylase large chain